jgi:hypothetical protein
LRDERRCKNWHNFIIIGHSCVGDLSAGEVVNSFVAWVLGYVGSGLSWLVAGAQYRFSKVVPEAVIAQVDGKIQRRQKFGKNLWAGPQAEET